MTFHANCGDNLHEMLNPVFQEVLSVKGNTHSFIGFDSNSKSHSSFTR